MTGLEYIKEAALYNKDNLIEMSIGIDGVTVRRLISTTGHISSYVIPWIEIEYAKVNPIIEAIDRLS